MSVSPLYQEVGVSLNEIETLSAQLECRYDELLKTEVALSRGLVSFQANKSRAVYRWYKFKEAFSADLVEYFLDRFRLSDGVMLDPFAGSGTALFVSCNMGLSAVGVELLPIGQRIIETKKLIDEGLTPDELKVLEKWSNSTPWHQSKSHKTIPELRITKDAYPTEAISSMEKFLYSIYEESSRVASVLFFALLCTLEAISFTRKDGQYLRWDHRTQWRLKGNIPFNKGEILSFDEAMSKKLKDIVADLAGAGQPADLFRKEFKRGDVTLHAGSCLEILPKLPGAHFDYVITSPPYCNRYDYTRTYALELAVLGVNETRLSELRQEMLSCTVENRGKDLLGMNPGWKSAISVTDKHELLQSVPR